MLFLMRRPNSPQKTPFTSKNDDIKFPSVGGVQGWGDLSSLSLHSPPWEGCRSEATFPHYHYITFPSVGGDQGGGAADSKNAFTFFSKLEYSKNPQITFIQVFCIVFYVIEYYAKHFFYSD
ncbi:MAG: hypothetical protein LBP62_01320 [Clostridiales bacterium]|nr:hypothetical protein [Clostridiales bacterium]